MPVFFGRPAFHFLTPGGVISQPYLGWFGRLLPERWRQHLKFRERQAIPGGLVHPLVEIDFSSQPVCFDDDILRKNKMGK